MVRINKNQLIGLAHFLVLLILLFPVWLFDIVPMPDFPSHMARIYVLSTIETNQMLGEIYQVQWDFLPNVALDLFVIAAAKFVPLLIAGKLFVSVCIVLWMGGTAWLHFALSGRLTFVPLIAALFVLNAPFFFGFLSFVFGAGIAITGLAAWVTMSSWRLLPRLLCFVPIALVAYFSHMMGFVILACCVFGFECGSELAEKRFLFSRALRRIMWATLPFVAVVPVYLFLTPHGGHFGGVNFSDIWKSYRRVQYASSLSFNEPYIFAIVFIAAVFGIGLITRTIAIDRRMWLVLIGLGLAALLAPIDILGGGYVHLRLPAIIGCLGIASSNVRGGRIPQIIVGLSFASLLIYRAVVVSEAWASSNRDYAELAASLARIQPGSKMFMAKIDAKSRSDRNALVIYSHYLDLIGVEGNIFTPRVFAWPGQHPLQATPAYRDLGAVSAYQGNTVETEDLLALAQGDPEGPLSRFPYLKKWQCKFDYVVVVHLANRSNPAPAMLVSLHTGTYFTLFKVVPPKEGCA